MWVKDALEAAKNVRLYRQMGCQEPLIMIPGPDLKMYTDIIEHERKANKLLMNCIEDMANGKSRCRYCEENRLNECPNPKKKGNVRGCPDWWLMFEEEYENEQTRKAQAAESPEEIINDVYDKAGLELDFRDGLEPVKERDDAKPWRRK